MVRVRRIKYHPGFDRKASGKEVLMEVQHLSQLFSMTGKKVFRAVDDVSFELRKGVNPGTGRGVRFP